LRRAHAGSGRPQGARGVPALMIFQQGQGEATKIGALANSKMKKMDRCFKLSL
jgi:hypothetical protein